MAKIPWKPVTTCILRHYLKSKLPLEHWLPDLCNEFNLELTNVLPFPQQLEQWRGWLTLEPLSRADVVGSSWLGSGCPCFRSLCGFMTPIAPSILSNTCSCHPTTKKLTCSGLQRSPAIFGLQPIRTTSGANEKWTILKEQNWVLYGKILWLPIQGLWIQINFPSKEE